MFQGGVILSDIHDNKEIYDRVSQSEEQRKEAFFVYYKNYINIPKYKKDKVNYIKSIGSVESALKDIKDVDRSFLIAYNGDIDKEVFLTLFSKKDKFTSNKYTNVQRIYDVYWDKCRDDNIRLDDSEIMYSTQDYSEEVLCIYSSDDTYVRGVGPIMNSLIDSRYNRVTPKGNRLLTWIFHKGTLEDMMRDKDMSMVYNYFKSANDNSEFLMMDLNNKKIVNNNVSASNNTGKLGDIY